MLSPDLIASLGAELAEATRTRSVLPRITARHPHAAVEDSYAIQRAWRDRRLADGHRIVGRKIGLTSRAMQLATGITEPDYGVMFDDTVWHDGDAIPTERFANTRLEVELAFLLKAPLAGEGLTIDDVLNATEHVTPALELLDSHFELEGRTIVDTISDNAAYGGLILGGRPVGPREVDLRWIAATLSRNGEIEETGVAAGVLGHPALGVAWLAAKLGQHGDRLEAGEYILAGSFTRPVWFAAGDTAVADYRDLGSISCRFV
ncbi:fumarylacetoacetate hydrolase family protein [Microcella sp.]|uniref:fumarylacetoacetate hydrolase family protein n=1 Tax=Microcella sp. TaxID=1913979 RepID=UPI00391BDBDF